VGGEIGRERGNAFEEVLGEIEDHWFLWLRATRLGKGVPRIWQFRSGGWMAFRLRVWRLLI
jgi:hypothetical protein